MKGIMAHINRERRIIDIARIKNEQVLNELRDIKQYTLLGAKSVYSIEEASMFTGLSKSRLYALTSNNEIPFYKQPKCRKLYFDRCELEEWMKARRYDTEEEIQQQAVAYTLRKKII